MMRIRLHPHAAARLIERGATQSEAIEAVRSGSRSPAKFGRFKFVRNFAFGGKWMGRRYTMKQVHAIAARKATDDWLIVTVIVKYF
jgi:hypothetical protein